MEPDNIVVFDGAWAHQRGFALNDNPFTIGTKHYDTWSKRWNERHINAPSGAPDGIDGSRRPGFTHRAPPYERTI